MKKFILAIPFFAVSTSAMAYGEIGQWSSGFGQGTMEYTAVASKGNLLYVACSDTEPVRMTLTVNGAEYGSFSKKGFDLVINGKVIQTPYATNSRVGENNFTYVWGALRKAKTIQARTTDGKVLTLPIKGAANALPANGGGCRTEASM